MATDNLLYHYSFKVEKCQFSVFLLHLALVCLASRYVAGSLADILDLQSKSFHVVWDETSVNYVQYLEYACNRDGAILGVVSSNDEFFQVQAAIATANELTPFGADGIGIFSSITFSNETGTMKYFWGEGGEEISQDYWSTDPPFFDEQCDDCAFMVQLSVSPTNLEITWRLWHTCCDLAVHALCMIDKDVCKDILDLCPETLEECVDTVDSYNCECIAGYIKDSTDTCIDADECINHTSTNETCSSDMFCVNTVGSFECLCNFEIGYDVEYDSCQVATDCSVANDTDCPRLVMCLDTNGTGYACYCDYDYPAPDNYVSCDEWDNAEVIIMSEPDGEIAVVTGSVTLNCTVIHSVTQDVITPDGYKWYKDGAEYASAQVIEVTSSEVGVVNMTCDAFKDGSKDVGAVMSVEFYDEWDNAEVIITSEPDGEIAVLAGSVTLNCTVIHSVTQDVLIPTGYKWYKDGTAYSSAQVIEVTSSEVGVVNMTCYALRDATRSVEAVVSVKFYDEWDSMEAKITAEPESGVVTIEESVTLNCSVVNTVTGVAPSAGYQYQYEWYKDGAEQSTQQLQVVTSTEPGQVNMTCKPKRNDGRALEAVFSVKFEDIEVPLSITLTMTTMTLQTSCTSSSVVLPSSLTTMIYPECSSSPPSLTTLTCSTTICTTSSMATSILPTLLSSEINASPTEVMISSSEMNPTSSQESIFVSSTQTFMPEAPTTTPPVFTINYSAKLKTCPCACPVNVTKSVENITAEAVAAASEAIVNELTVDTKNLSATVRVKSSAKDERSSSVSMGVMALVMLALEFTFFILGDVITVAIYFYKVVKNLSSAMTETKA